MSKCEICSEVLDRFEDRKSFYIAKKSSDDNSHFHHGITYYLYGICSRHHLTRLQKTKVIWDPCIKCNMKGVTKYKIVTTKKETEKEIVSLRMEISELREEMKKYRNSTLKKKKYPERPSEPPAEGPEKPKRTRPSKKPKSPERPAEAPAEPPAEGPPERHSERHSSSSEDNSRDASQHDSRDASQHDSRDASQHDSRNSTFSKFRQ